MDAAVKIFFVALGGALGALARYAISISPLYNTFEKFPFPTFLINIIGSFLIGFFFIVFEDRAHIPEYMRLFVFIGFLGAFTTFSTFELEIWSLIKDGDYFSSLFYVTASVVVGFAGLLGGVWLGRQV